MTKTLFINGKWRVGHGKIFQSFNPATKKMLWEGPSADFKDVAAAVKAARQAFCVWAKTPLEQRKKYLEHFAFQLTENKDMLAEVISQETGKPLWESLSEVESMINKVSLTFKAYQERCHESQMTLDGAERWVRYKPYGVAAVLGPFNLPGHLSCGHIIPLLLAGNTIVFKPSELTPLVAEKMMELWEAVGLPEGVLNSAQGAKAAGQALIRHAGVDGIFFTGSAATGQVIHRFCGGHPEKILALEMGGNNPLIVWEPLDLQAAAYLTIQSAFITTGQRCSCARRLIIQKGSPAENFLKILVELTQKIRIGEYTQKPEPFMGPVISKEAAYKILQFQSSLQAKGGKILLEMKFLNKIGAFLTPGIMDTTVVKNRPDVEIFGPFLQVIRVKNFEEAIEEANRTAFGLTAGILTGHFDLYQKFFQYCRAGIINWNRPLTGASSLSPFGGIGISGNHQPSGYFAVDYCAYPVASIEAKEVVVSQKVPGIIL